MEIKTAFRVLPASSGMEGLRFQVLAPPAALHKGALVRGAQVVLHWSRDDALNCMATMLTLMRAPEFARRDGFQGREVPPCVVPIKLGEEPAPEGAVCRVIVEAERAEPAQGQALLTVELAPERVAALAERLLRRCGLKRVLLVAGGRQVAWEEAKTEDA